jgi:hypothetical protein
VIIDDPEYEYDENCTCENCPLIGKLSAFANFLVWVECEASIRWRFVPHERQPNITIRRMYAMREALYAGKLRLEYQ